MSTSVSSLSSNFFPSAENGFTTTTSGSVSSGAATVGLNSVAGYSNGEIAVFIIDPTDVSKKQTFTGVIDTSGVQVTSVVWTAGTNQTHALGATVVDYATATHISMITKGLTTLGANQDGTITPKTKTSINDVNGNELVKVTATASAVNEFTVTNAATATAPILSATGGDTNIDIAITPKGTGKVLIDSFYSWQRGTGTWTYASASTFTVPQVDADLMSVGTKIWLTQTTSKYFYVTGISGTTITVTAGSDYTVANAAITAPYFSNASIPAGFPSNFAFAPTLNNFTLGSGTVSGEFTIKDKFLEGEIYIAFGTSMAFGSAMSFNLPVTAATKYGSRNMFPIGEAVFYDNTTAQFTGKILTNASATVALVRYMDSTGVGTKHGFFATSAGNPMTLATGDAISITFKYMLP